MKIKYVMKPWGGDLHVPEGLNENADLYFLNLSKIRHHNGIVDVVNDQNRKIGEIKKQMLNSVLETSRLELISSILDKSEEGIVAIDRDGKIFYANAMYSKILGVPIGKIMGKQMSVIEPGAAILNILEDRKPIILDRQYIKTIDKYVSGKIVPLSTEGEFRGAVSIFHDATELVELHQHVERAHQMAFDFEQQMKALQELQEQQIIGRNPEFLNMIFQASIAAKADVPVMIRGENGSGKEVVAQFIHKNSSRAHKPLITVNCAAIPDNLIESELFGYEEGAFTGARHGGKTGKFELAHGGTLFLDEIGDMPSAMQAKVLRAIQENEIEKIGGEKRLSVDVRIITATNQPLEAMMEEKTFRKDLYFRLNTVSLQVPSLRDRREDILPLADHFLKEYNKKYEKDVILSEEVLLFYDSYPWPGNVRELRNCIEYAVIMCQTGVFDKNYLSKYMKEAGDGDLPEPESKPEGHWDGIPLKQAMREAEKSLIQRALKASDNNRTATMKILGMSRRTFYRKLQDYHI